MLRPTTVDYLLPTLQKKIIDNNYGSRSILFTHPLPAFYEKLSFLAHIYQFRYTITTFINLYKCMFFIFEKIFVISIIIKMQKIKFKKFISHRIRDDVRLIYIITEV